MEREVQRKVEGSLVGIRSFTQVKTAHTSRQKEAAATRRRGKVRALSIRHVTSPLQPQLVTKLGSNQKRTHTDTEAHAHAQTQAQTHAQSSHNACVLGSLWPSVAQPTFSAKFETVFPFANSVAARFMSFGCAQHHQHHQHQRQHTNLLTLIFSNLTACAYTWLPFSVPSFSPLSPCGCVCIE